MKVLLLNPEDTPWSGDWKHQSWDLIVDLGWAGPECYRRWSQKLQTRVFSLFDLQEPLEIFRHVGKMIALGRNRVVDSFGLDWWELQAAVAYQQFQLGILLRRLQLEIKPDAELYASGSSSTVSAAGRAIGREIPVLGSNPRSTTRLRALVRRAWRLTPRQTLEIAFDKWDSAYQLRRIGARPRRVYATDPLVLMPSPYVNVSRAVLEYAKLLPHRKFLLASTRHSGTWSLPPENVLCTALAAYASPSKERRSESESLLRKWRVLKAELVSSVPEIEWGCAADLLPSFPSLMATGLAVRDAWRCLLQEEPIHSVLCADDLNIYTRIPLILAKQLGLRTIYCAHGALDCSLLFKQQHADVLLAHGEMERDFMVTCGVPEQKIVVGAASPAPAPEHNAANSDSQSSVVFFSQPYEVYGGRAAEAYREILPALCEIARQHNRNVVVKLHPFESRWERKRLIESVVDPSQRSLVEISDCRFASELFGKIWFGVSVNSSVAVECTLHGIPFFNCGWLETKDCGYAGQFGKFSAGRLLQAPEDLNAIPEYIREFHSFPEKLGRISQPIQAATLDQVFFGDATQSVPARRKAYPKAVSGLLRQLVYPSLAASKYLRRRRQGRSDTLAVLTYHGVLPASYRAHDAFFDDAMIQADAFRRQLTFLKANYSVITPEDCQQWLQGRIPLPDGAVLLTCDDGLLNNLTAMVPVLQEEGLRCLFFLTGYSLSDRPRIPWYFQLYFFLMSAPADLSRIDWHSAPLNISLRSRGDREATWWQLLRPLSKHDKADRESFLEGLRVAADLPEDWESAYRGDSGLRERYLPLSASDLGRLLDSGMTIGGHTISHPVLARTSAELAWKEILEGRRALEQAVGKAIWAFAYPFGDAGSVTKREFEFAQEAGYECAFLNFGGCVSDASRESRFALPRLHVSANMQLSELEALVSGFDWSLRQFFGA